MLDSLLTKALVVLRIDFPGMCSWQHNMPNLSLFGRSHFACWSSSLDGSC
jgi:hypothetical protein